MRSWRRGMKEMDIVLGPFADRCLADLPVVTVTLYDRLLGENDQDIYAWITGAAKPPAEFAALLDTIVAAVRPAAR
ncbi:MAG: succinate dehydrogenase assembly factor 2 [Rhodobacteraceae bacterium]|nr:succinate dehydrogenase assembly factor 2 [Paracoccaceae bacterium]